MATKKPVIHADDHRPDWHPDGPGSDPANWLPEPVGGGCNCGMVISSDYVNQPLYAFDTDGNPSFTFVRSDLWHPIDMAFDHWNNIYVVNNNLGTTRFPIYKFNHQGIYLASFGTAGNGNADERCDHPTGMCLDAAGNLYIVDGANNRIQQWDSFGSYVAKWGTTGTGNGQFNFQSGGTFASIAYDGTYLYVTDPGNHRVQKFSTAGVYQTQWGTTGVTSGKFTQPNGIAVALDGTIYVVDDGWNPGTGGTRSRVQHFTNTGTYIDEYDSATYGTGDGEFEHPNGIDIDSDGNIYVADEYNSRIQKFDSSFVYVAQFALPNQNQGIAVRPNAVPV